MSDMTLDREVLKEFLAVNITPRCEHDFPCFEDAGGKFERCVHCVLAPDRDNQCAERLISALERMGK